MSPRRGVGRRRRKEAPTVASQATATAGVASQATAAAGVQEGGRDPVDVSMFALPLGGSSRPSILVPVVTLSPMDHGVVTE
jgi:hypothetical protein